jgi:uncharacterized protein YdhG (YjbR/CyaY superfamily)
MFLKNNNYFNLKMNKMEALHTKFKTVDEYISAFSASTQKLLQDVRKTIKKAAPQAEELISYNMPAFKFHGVLVYYAAYKNHIGFYPTASGIRNFEKEIAHYENSKGAVQFPIDKSMPVDLITKIVKFRVKENIEKEKAKKKRA